MSDGLDGVLWLGTAAWNGYFITKALSRSGGGGGGDRMRDWVMEGGSAWRKRPAYSHLLSRTLIYLDQPLESPRGVSMSF